MRKDFAPEFSTTLRSGEKINLDALKGKVVVLDFWGTWCTACRASLPLLRSLAASVDPEKAVIISIDGDPVCAGTRIAGQTMVERPELWARLFRSGIRGFCSVERAGSVVGAAVTPEQFRSDDDAIRHRAADSGDAGR